MAERRSVRRHLRALLLLDEPPERTARTFGLGVFIGFSPFIGFHTLIAVGVMLVVRLNRLAFLAGVFLNTWTLGPSLALGTGLGLVLVGRETTFPELTRKTLASGQFWSELSSDVSNLLVPFLLGNLILAAAAAFVAIWILKWVLSRNRWRRNSDSLPSPKQG